MTFRFSVNQAASAARHAATFVGGMATMLGVIHVITADQATQLITAVTQIAEGVGNLLVVLGPILAGIMGWLAQRAASTPKQADALANSGEVHQIIATPELAKDTKSPRVVSGAA